MGSAPGIVEVDIPARLDRLPWGSFHTRIAIALGITWILDGLEVTLAGSVAGALRQSPQLQLDEAGIGLASSAYLAGAVFGALVFGWLSVLAADGFRFFGLYASSDAIKSDITGTGRPTGKIVLQLQIGRDR